ncbi:MAG: cytochrome c [Myxococcales bacterium]|nr:cytochrome c [Myxococcales bacterium]
MSRSAGRASVWAVLGLAFTLAGCGEGREQPAPAPSATQTPAATPPPAAPPAPVVPAAPPASVVPAAPSGPADASRGAANYAILCAGCHGASGDGDGPLAAALDPKPAKHSDGAYMNALSDAHLFQVIQQGGASVGKSPMMAPFGASLSDAQIRDLVAHVRSLAKNPPYSP